MKLKTPFILIIILLTQNNRNHVKIDEHMSET